MNRSTSLYLDIIRPAAALVVLLYHVGDENLSGGQLKFMSSAGFQAVDVFFALSGFVIAHVYAARENDARRFMISRAARIYSVAIPVLILTAVLDRIGTGENPAVYTGPFQPFTPGLVIRSVLFLGEQWNAHRFPGSDGAYWSLGFEVWYYAAFAAFVFVRGWMRWVAVAAILVFIGPKVTLMFPAWLMGVATYRLSQRPLPAGAGWACFILSIAALAGFQAIPHSALQQFAAVSFASERIGSTLQDYFITFVFCVNIIGFVAISGRFAPVLERHSASIRWIAGGTFSIYLAHLPIMHVLAAFSPWPPASAGTLALLTIVTPAACMAFAEISERRKTMWWKAIDRLLPGRTSSSTGPEHVRRYSRPAAPN